MEPTEEWREILDGYYWVSNTGRVKRRRPTARGNSDRDMSQFVLGRGYLAVKICAGKERGHHYVHRLVAQAFLGPCPAGLEVNHRDGNKRNNRSDNLEYISHLANVHHAIAMGLSDPGENARMAPRKLSDEDVRGLRCLRGRGVRVREIAGLLSISTKQVYTILAGRSRQDVASWDSDGGR